MTKTLVATADGEEPERPIIGLDKELDKWLSLSDTQQTISVICEEIKQTLLSKNRKYGNSALKPIKIYSKADPKEQLYVRIDDKLNRKLNRQEDEDEDIDLDLIGYLILCKVHDRLFNDAK